MSRQRLPRTSGHGIRSTMGRRSNQPLVVTPGATSIVWYQNGCSSTARCMSAAVRIAGVVVDHPGNVRRGHQRHLLSDRPCCSVTGLESSPVRIAFTHAFCWPEVRRGAERFTQELGAALVERGHEVTILSAAGTPPQTSSTAWSPCACRAVATMASATRPTSAGGSCPSSCWGGTMLSTRWADATRWRRSEPRAPPPTAHRLHRPGSTRRGRGGRVSAHARLGRSSAWSAASTCTRACPSTRSTACHETTGAPTESSCPAASIVVRPAAERTHRAHAAVLRGARRAPQGHRHAAGTRCRCIAETEPGRAAVAERSGRPGAVPGGRAARGGRTHRGARPGRRHRSTSATAGVGHLPPVGGRLLRHGAHRVPRVRHPARGHHRRGPAGAGGRRRSPARSASPTTPPAWPAPAYGPSPCPPRPAQLSGVGQASVGFDWREGVVAHCERLYRNEPSWSFTRRPVDA